MASLFQTVVDGTLEVAQENCCSRDISFNFQSNNFRRSCLCDFRASSSLSFLINSFDLGFLFDEFDSEGEKLFCSRDFGPVHSFLFHCSQRKQKENCCLGKITFLGEVIE